MILLMFVVVSVVVLAVGVALERGLRVQSLGTVSTQWLTEHLQRAAA